MLPVIKGSGKKLPAAQVTDEEFVAYVQYPDTLDFSEVRNEARLKRGAQPEVCREIKMLAILARTIGGCRTSDLHALDWSRMDTENWTTIVVQRQKVERTDTYEIPEVVVPFLKSWWVDHDRPEKGPVFPSGAGAVSNGGDLTTDT